MVNFMCLSNITTSSFVLLVITLGRMELRRSGCRGTGTFLLIFISG